MTTWLLTWNPDATTWKGFRRAVKRVEEAGELCTDWSCGKTRRLLAGERFFFLAQGRKLRGLVGSGWIDSDPFPASHWRDRRKKALYVDVVFDTLFEEPPLTYAFLIDPRHRLDCTAWRTQMSGVRLPPKIAIRLERLWARQVGLEPPEYQPGERIPSEKLSEGAIRRIVVNALERNPLARRRCLEHHGCRCAVCGKELEEVYGPIARGLVEVHHRHPLSGSKKAREVDPVRDLVPVCPDCHAVIHRKDPPFTVAALKSRLGKRKN